MIPDILLYTENDRKSYSGIEALHLETADGGTAVYSYGIPVAATKEANFSNGDWIISADSGTLLSSVTVPTPATLVPENIVKDVNIAGVIGSFEGSGEGSSPQLIDWVNEYTNNIDNHAYINMEYLRSVTFTKATSIATNSFYGCSNLCIADFHALEMINGPAFNKNLALHTMIIRTPTLCSISSTATSGLFGGKLLSLDFRSPIALGIGYIYVPAALLESYQSSSDWTKYASQLRAIEDYPEICGTI